MTTTNQSSAKFVFWAAFAASFLLLMLAVTSGFHWAERASFSGAHRLGGQEGTLVIPILIVSLVLATVSFRSLGISADGKFRELLRRSPQVSPNLPEPVELRTPRAFWSGLAIILDVSALILVLMVTFLPAVPKTQAAGYCAAVFIVLFSIGPWYGWFTRNGLTARVDAEGIRAENAGAQPFVSWSQIAACEIFTIRTVFGKDAFTRYVFQSAEGLRLMTVAVLFEPTIDRDRFDRAVREAFRDELLTANEDI